LVGALYRQQLQALISPNQLAIRLYKCIIDGNLESLIESKNYLTLNLNEQNQNRPQKKSVLKAHQLFPRS
jgi:hypothetical protein